MIEVVRVCAVSDMAAAGKNKSMLCHDWWNCMAADYE